MIKLYEAVAIIGAVVLFQTHTVTGVEFAGIMIGSMLFFSHLEAIKEPEKKN